MKISLHKPRQDKFNNKFLSILLFKINLFLYHFLFTLFFHGDDLQSKNLLLKMKSKKKMIFAAFSFRVISHKDYSPSSPPFFLFPCIFSFFFHETSVQLWKAFNKRFFKIFSSQIIIRSTLVKQQRKTMFIRGGVKWILAFWNNSQEQDSASYKDVSISYSNQAR